LCWSWKDIISVKKSQLKQKKCTAIRYECEFAFQTRQFEKDLSTKYLSTSFDLHTSAALFGQILLNAMPHGHIGLVHDVVFFENDLHFCNESAPK
jgi:hypothetical protein